MPDVRSSELWWTSRQTVPLTDSYDSLPKLSAKWLLNRTGWLFYHQCLQNYSCSFCNNLPFLTTVTCNTALFEPFGSTVKFSPFDFCILKLIRSSVVQSNRIRLFSIYQGSSATLFVEKRACKSLDHRVLWLQIAYNKIIARKKGMLTKGIILDILDFLFFNPVHTRTFLVQLPSASVNFTKHCVYPMTPYVAWWR